ncbi:hypothetical protein M378DRAFT_154898 [Amanita muscaria Koide BX008]|uniref:Uncharacterized protein n=1 Tax=Amanita muscaria (strain Koide BX008) TaxID=946122 RepID=A0A0C2XP12_AMAMK|nr:hypothetical protein M378DRAFT_154898 [Amanita muscaria Koide BX008]
MMIFYRRVRVGRESENGLVRSPLHNIYNGTKVSLDHFLGEDDETAGSGVRIGSEWLWRGDSTAIVSKRLTQIAHSISVVIACYFT